MSAAIAVGLGAFGAHGLEGFLSDRHVDDPDLYVKRMDNWRTAAAYQMYHSIGLILVGFVSSLRPSRILNVAGFCFMIGIVVFSGLLYALVLSEVRVLGAIVPIGGTAMICGWIALAIGGCCLSPIRLIDLDDTKN